MTTFIDPLRSLAFAPTLGCFQEIKGSFETKIERVETMACLAVEDSPYKTQAHLVFKAIQDLKNVSEELLRSISKPQGIHFRHINFSDYV